MQSFSISLYFLLLVAVFPYNLYWSKWVKFKSFTPFYCPYTLLLAPIPAVSVGSYTFPFASWSIAILSENQKPV